MLYLRILWSKGHATHSLSLTWWGEYFLSLTFPQKLWNIFDSDQFESICWDESGTCIVINEELFKKEVLETKGTFRIFETKSMKSSIRQLNLYEFSKKRQTFQRSASLPVFLEEEEKHLFWERYSNTFTYWTYVSSNHVTEKNAHICS